MFELPSCFVDADLSRDLDQSVPVQRWLHSERATEERMSNSSGFACRERLAALAARVRLVPTRLPGAAQQRALHVSVLERMVADECAQAPRTRQLCRPEQQPAHRAVRSSTSLQFSS